MRRIPQTAMAVMLLLAATLRAGEEQADEFSAVISGPSQVRAGELVKLQAKLVYQREWLQVEADQLTQHPQFLWELANPPEGYEISEWTFADGQICVFATAAVGRYQFFLAGAHADASGAPRLFIARHTLTVGPPAPPGPEPDPVPPPPGPPDPDLPDGRFGLARLAYRTATEHVPAPERAAAKPLAENYRSIAAQIAAGALAQPDQILSETTAGNRRALGERRDAWKRFFEELAVQMQQLDQAGRLKAAEDFQEAWVEIAAGLEAVPLKGRDEGK